MVLQSQAFKCKNVFSRTVCSRKRPVQVVYLTCFILLALQIPSFSQNVEYEFEDDRDVKTVGNVRHVESRSVYTTRQIDVLKKEVAALKDDVKALQEARDGAVASAVHSDALMQSIDGLTRRVDELYASQEEIIASQNELIANIESISKNQLVERVEKLEHAVQMHAAPEEEHSEE